MAANERGVQRLAPEDGGRSARPIYNWLSVIGAGIAVVGATIAVFLVIVDLFTEEATGYAGLALLPPFLLSMVGCVLVGVGWTLEVRRRRRGERSRFADHWLIDPLQIVRNTGPVVLLLGIALVTLALVSGGAGSVAVVEFSESNTFCSDVCHDVMGPEATSYHLTAHSRVACVECHVGAGAEGFIQAKVGGLRQLWAIASGSVRRPIPTPIHSNHIGRKLCEKCHSPAREVGYKMLTRRYYLSGLEDSPRELAMLLKVGGTTNGLIPGGGIHYHMVIAKSVEFVARDPQRQDIAWIRVTDDDGSVREYEDKSTPLTNEEKASLVPKKMDCIDCHSRPAHAFASPIDLVNEAIRSERLPNDLYYIKEASVRALDGGYDSVSQAMSGIEASLRAYYEEEDPDVLEERSDDLASAADVLGSIYRRAVFPEMRTDWRTHPNNLGHRDSPGCFRCHSEDMADRDGNIVFTDCNGCHVIMAQDDSAISTVGDLAHGMGFAHPQDGEFIQNFKMCSNCHTGGPEFYD